MEKYLKVNSLLKAATGVDYVTKVKKNGKEQNKSNRVLIPGKYRPKDFKNGQLPFIILTNDEYKGLMANQHGGVPSPFAILRQEHKIIVEELEFDALPPEFQKKFDPAKFAKLEEARLKFIAKEAEKAG